MVDLINNYVIVRTYSAGVWAGVLTKKEKNEVYLTEARRLYKWVTLGGMSLSEVANKGLHKDSRICEPVELVWLEAIEIIPCTKEAKSSIVDMPTALTL